MSYCITIPLKNVDSVIYPMSRYNIKDHYYNLPLKITSTKVNLKIIFNFFSLLQLVQQNKLKKNMTVRSNVVNFYLLYILN